MVCMVLRTLMTAFWMLMVATATGLFYQQAGFIQAGSALGNLVAFGVMLTMFVLFVRVYQSVVQYNKLATWEKEWDASSTETDRTREFAREKLLQTRRAGRNRAKDNAVRLLCYAAVAYEIAGLASSGRVAGALVVTAELMLIVCVSQLKQAMSENLRGKVFNAFPFLRGSSELQ